MPALWPSEIHEAVLIEVFEAAPAMGPSVYGEMSAAATRSRLSPIFAPNNKGYATIHVHPGTTTTTDGGGGQSPSPIKTC